jgi:hypothetical protein
MRFSFAILVMIWLLSSVMVFSQQTQSAPIATGEQIEKITRDISRVAVSVDELNKQLKQFFGTFTTNQGIKLSEKQQKILFAFEILNRAEQRLSTLQTLKLSLIERQSSTRLTLARINDDLMPESIDKYVAVRGGTTNAEQFRQMRRQVLENEKTEITNLLNELDSQIDEITGEIVQILMFIRNVRQRIFGEINREIADL